MKEKMIQAVRQPDVCLFGTWIKCAAPETLECLAIAGFDFVVLDMEHAPLTLASAYRSIVMGQALGMHVLVRLPDSSGSYVQRILDSGADGVLVPRVRSETEARQVIGDMLFSPCGGRGLGITSRAGHWGTRPKGDYVREGDDLVFRGLQLEDASALGQAERILDVEGVNAVFVGAGDLALSTGKPAAHPDNARLIGDLLAAAQKRNVPCGTAVGDIDSALKARDQGYRFVMVSNDLSLFLKAAGSLVAGLRA